MAALVSAGLAVTILSELEAFPDSVFAEGPTLVFVDGAMLLRSAALARKGEALELEPDLRERFDTVLALGADLVQEGKGMASRGGGARQGNRPMKSAESQFTLAARGCSRNSNVVPLVP